jgi:hypothetical protein
MTFKTTAIAAAVLVAAFGAQAGTVTTSPTTFATEGFGSTATATTTATVGAAALTFSVATTGGIVVNGGGTLYYYVRLTNGTFSAAPGALTGTALSGTTMVSSTATLSADKTTARWTLTNGNVSTTTIGVGATLSLPSVVLAGVNTTFGTAGGMVTGAASLSSVAPAGAVPDTGTAQPADLDGAAATGTVATASKAVIITTSNAGAGKIDVTTASPSTTYTALGANTGANLGLVKLADSTAAEVKPDGATAVTVASATTGSVTTVVVTPGAGQSFPVGSVLSYTVGATCGAATGPLAAFTSTTASTAATLTIAPTDAANAAGVSICLSVPSAGNTASPIQPTFAVNLTNASVSSTPQADTASGTGYLLTYNGSQVDVTNYVPVAVSGWTQFLRIANTGSQAATVTGAFINDTTGVVGTAAVLIQSLPAGATMNLTGTQVEAALGAQAQGARPRVRITAPTSGLSVQNLLFTPNGSFTNNSSVQTETPPLNK